MNAFEPRVRRRGYFLSETESGEHEVGETESPEGVTFRVRIIRPLRQRVAVAARPAVTRHASRSHRSSDRKPAAQAVKSTSETGTRQP